jgi:N-acetylglutamate synthase-like GNAT family acetyltransferase
LRPVQLRSAKAEDAEAIVRLGREFAPHELFTVDMIRTLLARRAASGTERLVAEADGIPVAWAPSGRYASGAGWFGGGVAPAYRHRGIGNTLYERIERRLRSLGVDRLTTSATDAEGRRFLSAGGFEVSNVQRRSSGAPRRSTCLSSTSTRASSSARTASPSRSPGSCPTGRVAGPRR